MTVSYKSVKLALKLAPVSVAGYTVGIISLLLSPILFSFVTAKIIDKLISTASGEVISSSEILTFIVAFSLIGVFSTMVSKISDYLDFRQYVALNRELTKIGLEKFAKLDEKYYEDPDIETLLLKVRDDYNWKPTQYIQEIIFFFAYLVQASIIFVVILKYSPLVAILIILSAVPQLIIDLLFGKKRWGIWDSKGDVKKHFWTNSSYISDHKWLLEIRSFGIADYLISRISNFFREFQEEQIKIENRRFKYSLTFELLGTSAKILALWFVVTDVIKKIITVGSFSFYLTQLQQLTGSINTLFSRISRIYEDSLFMESFFKFMELEEETTSGELKLDEDRSPPTIEIKHLNFVYPRGTAKALEDINLKINPGDHIAIVGENGAGKSTLIKILMKFYDYADGEIKVSGKELRDLELHNWYKQVGTLFQEFNAYYFEPRLNIGVGNINMIDDLDGITEAAKKSGAHDFIEKFDKGYDQILSKSFDGGIEPSVGQWQKLALARAFFRDAPILILDEPTSAIDPKAEYEIFQRLFEFTKGKTVIIISHRFSTVRNAQRIIVLHEGKIVEEGSHEDLMKLEGGMYKNAFELQKKGYE